MSVKDTDGDKGPATLARSLVVFSQDIKLAHSVFALPFAASAIVLAKLPMPAVTQILWLLACMVTARTFAMGMNRIIDRDLDKLNPRTRKRRIAAGELAHQHAWLWTGSSGVLFVVFAFLLNPLAGILSVPVLAILAFYPWWKKIGWLTHWYLGLCLGLAPMAVCVAMIGRVPLEAVLLGIAVATWTGGFDVLYALQDWTFDLEQGLKSVPARFGPAPSLLISRVSFVLSVSFLVSAGLVAAMGPIYYLGTAVVAAILVYEHLMVRDARHDGESKHIGAAFFNANACVSIIFFGFTLADRLVYNPFWS